MFGPKIILAENRHEAVGKLLEMVQKEYPPSEGWTTEIVVGEISWAELQMYANAVKVNND